MKALLKQRADVNAADVDGTTALQWAAHWNDLDTVKALHRRRREGERREPLRRDAAPRGRHDRQRADRERPAQGGRGCRRDLRRRRDALMLAARSGNVEAVKLLLEAGANVNAAERFRGQTALMLAAVENHAAVVQALIAAGAQVNARTVEYHVPGPHRRRRRHHPRPAAGWSHGADPRRPARVARGGRAAHRRRAPT